MEKEQFLLELMKKIQANPHWAADALLAINQGVIKFSQEAQEKLNTANLFFKLLDNRMKEKLKKAGVNID